MQDLQSAWMILLHCAAARANYQIRCVSPGGAAQFARYHDEQIWECVCNILQLDPIDAEVGREFSTLPLSVGGLGLRSASRLRESAFWASWADCLEMFRQRHPEVAAQLVDQLEGFPDTPVLEAAATAARSLNGVMGFEPPSWHALAAGARPEPQPEEFEIRSQGGWQHEAASRIERRFRDVDLFSRLDDPTITAITGGAGLAVSTCPTCRITRIEPQLFRVLLLRRLQLPLPMTVNNCRCSLPLDLRGHHQAACARAGVLGKRGYTLETVTARICREAGGTVATNVMVRDLDLAVFAGADGRRLEVVVDGLPLFGGSQLAVDATLVSALHVNGQARRGAAQEDGAALTIARRRKERRYPELVGTGGRARLVVLGLEVGGRWSVETQIFIWLLARGKARSVGYLVRRRVEHAWRLRWGSVLSCTAARAVARSLLELLGKRKQEREIRISSSFDGELWPTSE